MGLSEYIGEKFGELILIEVYADKVRCKCKCGKAIVIKKKELETQISCGRCFSEKKIKSQYPQEMVEKPEFAIWLEIIKRTFNKQNISSRWLAFENFYEDMGDQPTSNHIIKKIKNNIEYRASNCKWALENDNESYTTELKKLCKEKNISFNTVTARMRCGWSQEDALNKPVEAKKRSAKRLLKKFLT